jgi:hypothetical protein
VAECTSSLSKTSFPGCQRGVFPKPHPAAGKLLGTPLGTFSATNVHGALVQSRCGVWTATLSPQWGQRPATVPKRCHTRGLKSTFSDPCASLWDAVAEKSALCENPITHYVLHSFCMSWRVPLHPQSGLGNAMCTRSFLLESPLPTSGAKVTPKVAPRVPKGTTRAPTDTPGTRKTHQKINLRPHLVCTAAREAPWGTRQ